MSQACVVLRPDLRFIGTVMTAIRFCAGLAIGNQPVWVFGLLVRFLSGFWARRVLTCRSPFARSCFRASSAPECIAGETNMFVLVRLFCLFDFVVVFNFFVSGRRYVWACGSLFSFLFGDGYSKERLHGVVQHFFLFYCYLFNLLLDFFSSCLSLSFFFFFFPISLLVSSCRRFSTFYSSGGALQQVHRRARHLRF